MSESSTRRGAIACRRCRRLRTRCIHDNGEGVPPCRSCQANGRGYECVFVKGNSVVDRKDKPRPKKRRATGENQSQAGADSNDGDMMDHSTVPGAAPESDNNDIWDTPVDSEDHTVCDIGLTTAELKENVKIYFKSYYQVGFLHKSTFTSRLESTIHPVSPFLLLAILALTAGASPSLVKKHGGSPDAARSHFKAKAMAMLAEECLNPGLECIQALYLLGLNDWGSGCGPRSWMLIGMGLRMVELLRLERRETYKNLIPTSSEAEQLLAESSRRTVWSLLVADDSLAIGFGSSPTPKLDVTIPTPCDEDDWEFGCVPLNVTRESASHSLMGNTISVMTLWSRAARWAASVQRREAKHLPWEPHSEFAAVDVGCKDFISGLSGRLRFTPSVLAAHRNRGTDMALTHLHLVYQGTQILLRRMHLPLMLSTLDPFGGHESTEPAQHGSLPPGFWQECAAQACRSAFSAIDISLEYNKGRTALTATGFTPLMCFVLFLGGAMTCFLKRWTVLCPELASDADARTTSAIQLLSHLATDMPVATRWHSSLRDLHSAFTNGQSVNSTHDNPLPSSPGRIDPLGVLADLAVTRPSSSIVTASNQILSGQNAGSEMFDSLGLSVDDFASHFGFSQFDFGGV